MSRILLVDDEYLISDILGFALEDAGYDVEKASNGKKALQLLKEDQTLLKENKVVLVITDYMMPVMNGEELATQVRDDATLKHLPIILMSGAQADIGKDKPALFNEVVAKPFDLNAMVDTVRKLIGPPQTPLQTPDLH
ncbi:response regulator [Pseudomonas aegrilactucae]|uniref:Response regulator n=1 Tax=Pseudomonas aegrilactucae TaxID=2854028 RepID=A0A9Q2XKU7_9PSED|nr:response regulator [Pseudomonas aegrilactucae]MBV6288205.1 response regulator [Pseudomonas aegrilactucae]